MKLLIISDTHLPKRGHDLPAQVWSAVAEADIVFHAGDWVAESLLDRLERRAQQVVGVWGNNDGPGLRRRLPEVARIELEGIRFAMTHETGAADGREKRCDKTYPETDVLIFGHSHIPWDTVTPNGLRLLNPGSPTDRRKQPDHTYLTATAQNGQLLDVVLHRMPPETTKA
ncbi:metallophosphoesterase family protein [Kineosporia babensis]|uniref:metallophosphoesterase family protein n=1 Tax=Kineosporia babensis TaxID=499548 RepID=UPI0022AEDBBB|nr:metallophosphoesterase [Kineosporia babensis]